MQTFHIAPSVQAGVPHRQLDVRLPVNNNAALAHARTWR